MSNPHLDFAGDSDRQVFDVDGLHVSASATGQSQQVLLDAHTHRVRPLCLCVDGGVPMYVARIGDRFIVKRMPDTGTVHVLKGASFVGDVKNLTYRTHGAGPANGWDVGFRVVREVE